jgi:hypothetical protein
MSEMVRHAAYIERVDYLFNQLTKHSSYYIKEVAAQAPKMNGKAFQVTVKAAGSDEAQKMAEVASRGGAAATAKDSSVLVSGNLGPLATAALVDADLLFNGQEKVLQTKYGMNGRRAIYLWWLVFGALQKQYLARADSAEAALAGNVRTKALEPAYNFVGIKPTPISRIRGKVLLLLGFYVVYTIWYGFSIMYLLDGLGLTLAQSQQRQES